MRGLAVLLVCVACGRIGFDEDDGPYISPTGDDSNPGTRAAPWLTFATATGRLHPNDRLTLLDGDYDASGPSGPLLVDCSAGAPSSTAAAPIVVRADHPRRAHVTSSGSALSIVNCTGWELDDLWFEGRDTNLGVETPLVHVKDCTDVTLRGLLVVHPNRYDNNHAVEIGFSQRILIEDTEAYDFFRAAFEMYASTAVTFRRLYANGRGAADIADGYPSTCPGGDNGVQSYYSTAGVIEDCITENTCSSGLSVITGRDASGDTGLGDHHVFAADISLGASTTGFEVFTDCDSTDPCNAPDRIASDNLFESCATLGATTGFGLEGINNTLDHVSATATEKDVELQVYDPPSTFAATASLTAVLGNGAPVGIVSNDQSDWTVTSSNIFGATTAYMPNDSHVTASTTIDPQLGGCTVYVPVESPMRGAGPNGTTVGADIRTQFIDGAPTAIPFWSSDGTFAGCGAVIANVNDDPQTSCVGVHQRLHVGTAGCALP